MDCDERFLPQSLEREKQRPGFGFGFGVDEI